MILKHTITSQRSYNNTWTIAADTGIPNGVIVDIGITLDRPASVGIGYIASDADTLTINLVSNDYQAGHTTLIASVSTDITGVPVHMNCISGCSASVVIGYIPENMRLIFKDPVIISESCIAVMRNNTAISNNKLRVLKRNNRFTDYTIDGKFIVISDENLELNNSNGVCEISLSGMGKALLLPPSDRPNVPDYVLKSINSIQPASDGVIYIQMSPLTITGSSGASALLFTVEGFENDDIIRDSLSVRNSESVDCGALNIMTDSEGTYTPFALPGYNTDGSGFIVDELYDK